MSSSNPPYPYYNGIPFNPSFFTSNTGTGLTQTQANALYLRKTVPDTATSQETFSGGINSSSINPENLSALDIANTTYALFAGAPAVNIGKNMTSGKINILGTGTSLLQVNGAGININYPVNSTTLDTIGSYQANNYNSLAGRYDFRTGLSFCQIPIVLPIGIYQATAKLTLKAFVTGTTQPYYNIAFYTSNTVLGNGVTASGGSINNLGGQANGYYFAIAGEYVSINFSAPVIISSSTVNYLSLYCFSDQQYVNFIAICSVVRIG